MNQPYHVSDDGRYFIVEQYNDQPPFASFLPGIAGVDGRPAWVFYVNRGQAIASFGTRNKDGAFLEFFPADKAYQLTANRGFRTFLKIIDGPRYLHHEPFQRSRSGDVHQRLYVAADEVGVEEINPSLGLTVRADMFSLPESAVAGLVRRVEIVNTADNVRCIEIVDGLPQVLPYAMNQWILKFMSRTSEAFMRVEGVDDRAPVYRLKVWPTDTPQVEPVKAANFFVGVSHGQRNPVIVDPERIFGLSADFSLSERFYSEDGLVLSNQVVANQTPSAFQTLTVTLEPGGRHVFYGLYGQVPALDVLSRFLNQLADADFFETKRAANRRWVNDIQRRAFTATGRPMFDAHVAQCYLDNGLRGGFPTVVPGGAVLHLFGRKHGDLERDYNDFLLQDTAFSEGNGDFRDVLQNRRVDVFFEPKLADNAIRYFFNLIQPDGYNPCSLRNGRFSIDDPAALAYLSEQYPDWAPVLACEFKYAELWTTVKLHTENVDAAIADVLSQATDIEDAEFDRGYWSDHWTYLVDLLVSFQAVFPDRMAALFEREDYSFFDPTHEVVPRARKYVVTADGVRQYGAVRFNDAKKALIESRARRRYQVRDRQGHGAIVRTTLLGKILTLVANKLATLDPFGVGIEMEADRPGWCDALNGLPGILGSSVNETIELKRLVDFTLAALDGLKIKVALPDELSTFICQLDTLIRQANLTADAFWRDSGEVKEAYRGAVFMGFAGNRREWSTTDVMSFLTAVSALLTQAVDQARSPEGIVTYFAYDAVDYHETDEGLVIKRFAQKPLPLFLEGFVHAMRIADADEARRLYAAVRQSPLFDSKLGMYRLNAPLGEHALDLGRIGVFNYGWLENGSIFLHMHYKFVLELVRSGLIDAFYADMDRLLVAFRDPGEYKRNPIENASFLVSSGFDVDPRQHGRACVARLSGSTVECLHLWLHLFLGPTPFAVVDGTLRFQPAPMLDAGFFSTDERCIDWLGQEHTLPANSAACTLFSSTLLVFVNAERKSTFGPDAVRPSHYRLYTKGGAERSVECGWLDDVTAAELREGVFARIDVTLV